MDRRNLIMRGLSVSAGLALQPLNTLLAQGLRALEVGCAGSMRAMLEGPLKLAAAQHLQLRLSIHAGGSDAIARSILDGTVPADVYLPITATPMRTLMRVGRAKVAYPVAGTEMVILYSPKSRFVTQFEEAAASKRDWWDVLQKPGLKFARSNPADDPGGRNVIFSMMVASKIYRLPGLVDRVLGSPMNPAQVQSGVDVRRGLENGEIDAAGSYKTATRLGNIPFLSLPPEINLTDTHLRERYPDICLIVDGKTFYPEPLFFYAAALEGAKNPEGAMKFVNWLRSTQAAAQFKNNGFTLPDTGFPALQ